MQLICLETDTLKEDPDAKMMLSFLIDLVACSNPAFEPDGGDLKAKRTSSDWGSVSLSRTGSPTIESHAASTLGARRSSDNSEASWMRPAATSAFHSRTGSVLSDWADSEGIHPPFTMPCVVESYTLHLAAPSPFHSRTGFVLPDRADS